jgi:hypothetical protein
MKTKTCRERYAKYKDNTKTGYLLTSFTSYKDIFEEDFPHQDMTEDTQDQRGLNHVLCLAI